MDRAQCTASNLLATASITIVGERIWADNTRNSNTSTVALRNAESQPIAASFTTGSDSNGYQMNNVKLQFGGHAHHDTYQTNVTVETVHRDATVEDRER